MTVALTTKLTLFLEALYESAGDLSTAKDYVRLSRDRELANGVGAGNADRCWHDKRALAAAAVDNLELGAGALRDAFEQAVELAHLKLIYIRNNDTVTELRVGGEGLGSPIALFDWGANYLSLPPGGELLLVCGTEVGWPVDAGASYITLTRGAGIPYDDTYDIVLIGEHA